MNALMRYQDINTEHNMKPVCREAVAQWTERLTRNGQTRVQISKGAYFNIIIVYTHSVNLQAEMYTVQL